MNKSKFGRILVFLAVSVIIGGVGRAALGTFWGVVSGIVYFLIVNGAALADGSL